MIQNVEDETRRKSN